MIIDFHAHIHPGADHGCRDVDTARSQLELARENGVGAVVTVSHYYPMRDNIDDYLRRRERGREELGRLTEQDGALPRVFFGTEVTLCHGLEKMPRLDSLTVEGTNLLLVEMPYDRWDASLLDTLESIRAERGIVPLLAHMDRYNPGETEALLRDGYMGQLNIEALTGIFGRRRLTGWAERGYISALGSDIHGVSVGYRHLKRAKSALGSELFDAIMARSARLLDIEEQK